MVTKVYGANSTDDTTKIYISGVDDTLLTSSTGNDTSVGGDPSTPVSGGDNTDTVLEWLFEGDGIDPRLAEDHTAVFTNASVRWYENISGVLVSAAANAAVFEYSAGTYLGYRQEPQRQNIALYSQDFSQGATWVPTNVTVASNSLAAPDAAVTADTLTATADNATVLQTIVSAQADRVFSLYIKRKTGTGNIDLTVDNGATWTTKVITSSWARYTITQATVTDPVIGIRIVTDTDAIYVWQADCEIGAAETSIIPTTTAPVTRAIDDLQLPVADGTNFRQSQGVLFDDVTFGFAYDTIALNSVNGILSLRNNALSLLYDKREAGGTGTIRTTDGTAFPGEAKNWGTGIPYKNYVRWSPGTNFQIGCAGSSSAAAAYDGAFALGTHFRIGYGATERFWLKEVRILRVDRGQAYGEAETA